MRSRLRLFALVGVLATAVDLGLFLVLSADDPVGLRPWAADVVGLAVAAVVAYLLNRWITFRGDRSARWVGNPGLFAVTAAAAGALDVAVLAGLTELGLGSLAAKSAAIVSAATVRWFAYRWILFTQVRREMDQRVDRPPMTGSPRASVVIPAYNEADHIESTVAAVRAALLDAGVDDHEILVVDDGSVDDTITIAERAGATVVRQDRNRGKGAAVRRGVLASTGRSIVFTDADLAYSPDLLPEVLASVEQGWDVVVGSRRHERTETLVRQRRIREFGGRMVNRLTHLVLLGHFRDTQCGLKGFRGDIGRSMFDRTRIEGFAFDVELFIIAEQDRLSLLEIPVSVRFRPGSSVRLVGDTAALLADLFRIRRWVGKGAYRPDESQRALLDARVSS